MSNFERFGFEELTTTEIEELFLYVPDTIKILIKDGYGLGRRGSNCLNLENYLASAENRAGWFLRPYNGSSKIVFGAAMKVNYYNTKNPRIAFFYEASLAGYHGGLHFGNNVLEVFDTSGVMVGSYAFNYTAVDFNYYEIELDTVANTFKLWLNEQLVLDLTGDFSGSPSGIAYWGFGDTVYKLSTYYTKLFLDDVYIDTSDRQGDIAVFYVPPTQDVQMDFTPSVGTDGFAMIDEIPLSLTDYIQSAAVGDKAIVKGNTDFTAYVADVIGVEILGYVNVPDGGVGADVMAKLKVGGVEYLGETLSGLGVEHQPIRAKFNVNPATGQPFTLTELLNLDGFGWEIGT